MKLLAIVGIALMARSSLAQTAFYVDGACGNDAWTGTTRVCQAPDGPKATIAAAVDVAFPGDTVWVADGVYTGPGNREIDLSNKSITLRSANGPARCIIDCEGAGRAFTFVGFMSFGLLEGFTITGGDATLGGGILIGDDSSVTISNCIVTGNTAQLGGGVAFEIVSLSSSPILRNCVIENNTAELGGGIYYHGHGVTFPTIEACEVIDNTATLDGGGIYLGGPAPTVVNCVFAENFAGRRGGGVHTHAANAALVNCTVAHNTTNGVGGGISCVGWAGGCCQPTLDNSVVWGNDAMEGPQLALLTMTGYGPSRLDIAHSSVQGARGQALIQQGSLLILGPGSGEFEPRFAGPGAGDYALRPGSRLIDAGDNQALPAGIATDILGNPRLVDDGGMPNSGVGAPPVDMGAHEFQETSCYADCDGSGALDVFDFLCYSDEFVLGAPYANCDGNATLDIFDFLCFQDMFIAGCP